MKNDTLLGCVGLVTLMLILGIIGMLVGGWAFMLLWGWFIVPPFELPNLTLLQSIGLVLVITFFRYPMQKQEKQEMAEYVGQIIGASIVSPLAFLGIGWIVLWVS